MFLFAALFLGAVSGAWALPSTGSTNLQVTTGITTNTAGNTLTINTPDKGILIWQNFGGGTDTIAVGDTVNYVLPSSKSSVLNIVTGATRTDINGALTSNGGVYVLNPNGIVIGSTGQINVNSLYLSTSDVPAFASYYYQQNGRLPVQDNLSAVAGSVGVANGAIIAVTDSIYLATKNVDFSGFVTQGNLQVNADGAVVLGGAGTSYVNGNTTITNPTGVTTLATAGNTFATAGNVVVNTTTGTVTNTSTSVFNARSVSIYGGTGDVSLAKVNSSTVTANAKNVAVSYGTVSAPTFSGSAAGNVSINSPTSLVIDLNNTAGTTAVAASGPLTLGNIRIDNTGASFTGTTITDSKDNLSVYGATVFNATAGGVNITKDGHSFGPVSITATADSVVNESAAFNFGTVTTPKLTVNTNSFVKQTGPVTSANVSITAAGDINLTAPNNRIGAVSAAGNSIVFSNDAPVVLGNVTATGDFTAVVAGPITQSTNTAVRAFGFTAMSSTGLTLTNTGNQFGGLSLDVTAAGTAALTEDTSINLAAFRGTSLTLKSLANIFTSGALSVTTDSATFDAAGDVTLTTNFRATNAINVKAGGLADLSLLSFATNLNSKYPTVIATSYKAPAP